MKRITSAFAFLLVVSTSAFSQPPKLIVGVVVDQMRYDYLYAFSDKLSDNGFKKLMRLGLNCRNTHYNYVPTYTGPGHASIYTGTTPTTHGIIANEWFDRTLRSTVYCVQDSLVKAVGTSGKVGKMSPQKLLSTTLGDELKVATLSKSKCISIALKDRSAILPGGHSANAAYWFDDASGNFITSSYYTKELPRWVKEFNAKEFPKNYLKEKWKTLFPIERYNDSWEDNNPYEKVFAGETSPTFPHDLTAISVALGGGYGILRATPYGNNLTTDFAIKAIEYEQLGKDNYTDLLAISFSSPDYVGHYYGPKSIEMQDCILRLDLEIAKLLDYLEKEIGKDNFLLFLTADHAAADVPAYLQTLNIPVNYFQPNLLLDSLNNYLLEHFSLDDPSERFIRSITNQQVFFNLKLLQLSKIARTDIEKKTAEFLRQIPGISQVLTRSTILTSEFSEGLRMLMQKGYNEARSGDVLFNYQPGWMEWEGKGTTHGSPYNYDTHVPLLFYGYTIQQGETTTKVEIIDIAPSLALLLNIPAPNGSSGSIIQQLFK